MAGEDLGHCGGGCWRELDVACVAALDVACVRPAPGEGNQH